jgi:hypothetical protein
MEGPEKCLQGHQCSIRAMSFLGFDSGDGGEQRLFLPTLQSFPPVLPPRRQDLPAWLLK